MSQNVPVRRTSPDPGMCSTRDDDDDRVYLTPNGETEKKALEAKFQRVSHGLVREGVQDGSCEMPQKTGRRRIRAKPGENEP